MDTKDRAALRETDKAGVEYPKPRLQFLVFANGRIMELSVAKKDESMDLGWNRCPDTIVHCFKDSMYAQVVKEWDGGRIARVYKKVVSNHSLLSLSQRPVEERRNA